MFRRPTPSRSPPQDLEAAAKNESKGGASTDDSLIVEAIAVEAEWKAGRSEWLILICLTLVNLIVGLDLTILVPALPVIAESLNGGATDTFWAGTSYLLSSSIVQPFLANLSDIFGRCLILQISLGFFAIGTLLCCTAQNFTVLLTGRTIQGIGGGGCIPLVHVIITDIIPLRKRAPYHSVTQLSYAVATITGPLIGGLFAQHATWRWCFYINFPFLAIAVLMAQLVIKLDIARPGLSLVEKLWSVDWIGGALFIGSVCSFLIGITWGGVEHPWASAQTLIPIAMGIIGFAATIYWEIKFASQPFLRVNLFSNMTANATYASSFLQGSLMFSHLYYLPFYFEACKNQSPTMAGLNMIAITAPFIPTSILCSLGMAKTGHYRWAIYSSWTLMTTAQGLLILLNPPSIPAAHWIPILAFIGVAHGAIMMSTIVCIQSSADPQNVAYAAATYTFVRSVGMSVGVAIGGTIFQNTLAQQLPALGLPSDVANNAEAFVGTLQALPDGSLMKTAYVSAYAASFQRIFEVVTAVAALGLCLTVFIRSYTMDKKLESEHVIRNQVSASPE